MQIIQIMQIIPIGNISASNDSDHQVGIGALSEVCNYCIDSVRQRRVPSLATKSVAVSVAKLMSDTLLTSRNCPRKRGAQSNETPVPSFANAYTNIITHAPRPPPPFSVS